MLDPAAELKPAVPDGGSDAAVSGAAVNSEARLRLGVEPLADLR